MQNASVRFTSLCLLFPPHSEHLCVCVGGGFLSSSLELLGERGPPNESCPQKVRGKAGKEVGRGGWGVRAMGAQWPRGGHTRWEGPLAFSWGAC